MTKCSFNNCPNDNYANFDKCILHCEKDNLNKISSDINFYSKFFLHVAIYIAEFYAKIEDIGNKENVIDYLIGKQIDPNSINSFKTLLGKYPLHLFGIIFRKDEHSEIFNYEHIFNKLEKVHFDNCKFYSGTLRLSQSRVFFQECIFKTEWELYNYNILDNVRNVLYQECSFANSVFATNDPNNSNVLTHSLFSNCTFQKDLSIEGIKIEKQIFTDTVDEGPISNKLKIDRLEINNCQIEDKLLINNYDIPEILLKDSEIKGKFEFRYNTVKALSIDNTNFNSLVECFQTTFGDFKIVKSIFYEFAGFQKCEFGDSADGKTSEFLYATFFGFVNFRDTKFKSGLDIRNINLKETPNFLNTEIYSAKTNRETFRFIKHSFDKVGNYIEANKFYKYEMLKYKEELRDIKNEPSMKKCSWNRFLNKSENLVQRIILALYGFFADYGLSVVRPTSFLISSLIIFSLIISAHRNNILYKICSPMNNYINYIACLFNALARSLTFMERYMQKGMEFISLIFYIIFTSLTWLIILAIKRKARR